MPPFYISLNEPVAIIMGSEDRGVNPSVLKIVDEKSQINGTIGSLNALPFVVLI
jgi:23S rRNA (guanosine2251-2'-O)-methyltransferase